MTSLLTQNVIEGATFEQFALQAGNHIAPGISQGEKIDHELPDPANAGVPWHKQVVEDAKKTVKNIVKMSFNAAAKKAQQEFDEQRKFYARLIAEKTRQVLKLEDMLTKAEAFQPLPGERHQQHKAFMISQLKEAIAENDTASLVSRFQALKPATPQEWKAAKLKKAQDDIASYGYSITRDIEQTKEDVAFITELRGQVKTQALRLK